MGDEGVKMADWWHLLKTNLDLPYLTPGTAAVPFGLPPVPLHSWSMGGLREENGVWRLEAGTGNGLEATFFMRFFPDTRALECWGSVVNRGRATVERVRQSLGVDAYLQLSDQFASPWLRTLSGAGRLSTYFPPDDYAIVDRQLLDSGSIGSRVALASSIGGFSSRDSLPAVVLGDERGTTGLAFMVEWAGTWKIEVEGRPDQFWATGAPPPPGLHITAGMWGLDLDLTPGAALPLPRVLITAYEGGLDAGGNSLRRHIRRHVTPRLNGEEVRPPTSFNHWESFQNGFSANILRPEVDAAAQAGLEYFCVDAGWFVGDCPRGIGNWDRPDPAKFPDGIRPFAEYVQSQGMKYGTWFEPEWAHVESDVYRSHPDWFRPMPELPTAFRDHNWTPGSWSAQGPEYAMMDFGISEVRQWWLDRIDRAYHEWGMRWLRWDFNREPREIWDDGVSPGEVGWRQLAHIQGVYDVWDTILAEYPDLLISQCASGGNRIELGTIRRGHTFWQSDNSENTDIVRAFQHGLNTFLPGNYADTHICQPHHHLTEYDFLSHGAGGFGYSGRLSASPRADFERYAAAVTRFKDYRHLLLGDYARPTGQARAADEYAKVTFADGNDALSMEFNHRGAGSARLDRW